jgi:hypothetical protein
VRTLPNYDAIIFGTPTRFGNMASKMRNFLDQTGGLWMDGALIGKVGSVFASTATQHGGQEPTITSLHTTLLRRGLVIVGVPYSCQGLVNVDEISGGTPYGATALAKGDGARQHSESELANAASRASTSRGSRRNWPHSSRERFRRGSTGRRRLGWPRQSAEQGRPVRPHRPRSSACSTPRSTRSARATDDHDLEGLRWTPSVCARARSPCRLRILPAGPLPVSRPAL